MAQILLNQIIKKEIKVDLFVKWLLEKNSEEQYFGEFNDVKCSRTEFLTYFLNLVHEEIPCLNKYGENPQKSNSFRSLQNAESPAITTNLLSEEKYDRNKSSSYSHALHKTFDRTERSFDSSPISSQNVCHRTSTPKLTKIQLEDTLNNAYVSPISPLYRNNNSFSTPKNEKQSFTKRSAEKAEALCLGDFIVNRKSSAKKKTNRSVLQSDETSRRIKPTSLTQVESNGEFRKSDNSFNNFQNTKEVSGDSLNYTRNFLAEERLKILSRKECGSNITVTSSKKTASLMNFLPEIVPNINLVTNKEELNYFIEIYVNILKNNLILNITSEIYFLISLLLTKHSNDCREITSTNSCDDMPAGIDFLNDEDSSELQEVLKNVKRRSCCSYLFETVHNVVYFAARCLESQIDVLKHYDKSTLNLLSQKKKTERLLEFTDSNLQTNVCFNLDTDNRDNFPTESAFQAFRKQRDLFYEILRIWDTQHLITGWSFSLSQGGKIKSLFGLQSEPATFVHFSRLFKAQLLTTCKNFQKEEGLSDMPFLSSIPNVDVDKLKRLNCRLVTKQTSNGINSVPVFSGHQEFYKDFIVIAANYTFNKHLCDTLIAEIVELNHAKISCTDLEEIDGSVDPSTRKAYVACLNSLRVLAKFLGFVESLPYKSDCSSVSEKVLSFQISLRKEVSPIFDVKHLLKHSLKQNSTVLTVPWIAEYLSMLDYVTLRLPYYVSLHRILFYLHRNCEKVLTNRSNSNDYNVSLVKFCLGWLFELPHFPDSEYFDFSGGAIEDDIFCPKTKCKVKECRLDDLDVIDQNILYVCCPYLEEIKKLLASNSLKRSVTVKHITPVTAAQSSNEIAKKRLEQQLEDAFFNGQPLSVRKTVEFVSERIASACVKHVCSAVVPPFKLSALRDLKDFFVSWSKEHNVISPTKEKPLKAALRLKVNQMAHCNLRGLRVKCEKEVSDITNQRVLPSITNLLSVDVLPQTRDVCVAITTRMCVERVEQWINSHVTVNVFTKDFNNETQKVLSRENRRSVKEKPVFQLPPGGSLKNHNENATSAFHVLEKAKGLSISILENSAVVNERLVASILDEAYATLTERSDVNECIAMYIGSLLIDVSLLLVTHKPIIMLEEELVNKFIRVWKCYAGKPGDLFKHLISPRNVMLLAQSCNEVQVWECFATFVACLLKQGILNCDELESQCAGFFRKEWDKGTLNGFTIFLRKFLNCYKDNGMETHKFTLLLEFLSDFCIDL